MFDTIDTDNSGFIDWKEFLLAMQKIKGAKTLSDKIDLFINVKFILFPLTILVM